MLLTKIMAGIYSILFIAWCFNYYTPTPLFAGCMLLIIAISEIHIVLLQSRLEEQNGK